MQFFALSIHSRSKERKTFIRTRILVWHVRASKLFRIYMQIVLSFLGMPVLCRLRSLLLECIMIFQRIIHDRKSGVSHKLLCHGQFKLEWYDIRPLWTLQEVWGVKVAIVPLVIATCVMAYDVKEPKWYNFIVMGTITRNIFFLSRLFARFFYYNQFQLLKVKGNFLISFNLINSSYKK